MGDPAEVLRNQMSLDTAIYAEQALKEAALGTASLQLIENATLL